jgi:outer membrane protein OmpA-like peptidoglycan-associated protein
MKRTISTAVLLIGGVLLAPAYPQAQRANPTQQRVSAERGDVPVFRVTVVARTIPAVNYRHRGGATLVDLRGTPLLPESHGEAKVESKQGYIEIEVEFDELEPATRFGPEYLTYVMWAITPEGRATNLGEILLNGSESKLNVTTELQAFGLIVTAEPYFAVSQPSDVVVMENVIRSDTRGRVQPIVASYELLKRGTYLMNTDPDSLETQRLDPDTPLELYEARNAVRLSRLAGADRYSREAFDKASRLLQEAEDAHERDAGRRRIVMAAREAAQTAEDARLIALQRQEDEHQQRLRQAAADREAEAVATARAEAQRREEAEADRRAADRRRADAEDAAERAARDRAESEAIAQRAARDKAQAEAALAAADRARAEAELASQRLAQERAAAEAARQASEAARQASEAQADQARRAAAQAEAEKAELRERLRQQLNVILETRESARGLIVNMSDVLFDTAQHTLRPGAREKLAKISGILLAYPDLRVEVEGHTDSVGDETYNQGLSERRAHAVREYLIRQGIPSTAIVAHGFGESRPVVSNGTAAGRQQNRRVELVVSGDSIGPTPSTSNLQPFSDSLSRYRVR